MFKKIALLSAVSAAAMGASVAHAAFYAGGALNLITEHELEHEHASGTNAYKAEGQSIDLRAGYKGDMFRVGLGIDLMKTEKDDFEHNAFSGDLEAQYLMGVGAGQIGLGGYYAIMPNEYTDTNGKDIDGSFSELGAMISYLHPLSAMIELDTGLKFGLTKPEDNGLEQTSAMKLYVGANFLF